MLITALRVNGLRSQSWPTANASSVAYSPFEPDAEPHRLLQDQGASLTDGEIDGLLWLTRIVGSFSLAGSLFILLSFSCFRELRTFQTRLVVMMAVSDMLATASYMIGSPLTLSDESVWCDVQAYGQTFLLSSVLWVSCVAYVLYQSVVREVDMGAIEALEPRMHALCWGLPLLLGALPFIWKDYGPAGAWCWIQDQNDRAHVLRIMVFYLWLFILVPFCAVANLMTLRKFTTTIVATELPPAQLERMRGVFKRLVLYPLILVVCWLPAMVNRAQQFITPDRYI